jgi:poly-beta-hydroxyalkanoate depolymerase
MVTRSPRLRLAKFVLSDTKRFLQHNLARGEIAHDSQAAATAVIDARAVRNGDCQFDDICAITYLGGA